MRRETAAAAALVLVCVVASCGFPVPSAEMDGGPVEDVLPPLVTVGFAEPTSLEDENSGTVRIPVTLSEPAGDPVTVTFAVAGGTATQPDDFAITSPSSTLTFPAGEVTQHVELAIVDDMVAEPNETIVLELASPTGATLGTSTHTLTINANALPRVSVRMSRAQDNENKTANVVFELDTRSSTDITVDFTLGGTATTADHGLEAGTVTFPADSMKQELPLGVINDALDEDNETIEVTLQNPVGALVATDAAAATYTIVDDDPEPVATFNTNAMTVAESATTVMFEVRLSAVSGRTVTVPFSVDDAASTATAGTDYTISSSPLTFPAGTQTQQIAITIIQDAMPEYNETIKIDLGMPTNATLGTPSTRTRTLTISNDDAWCGGSGAFQVCYPQLPASARTLPGSIDTNSSTLCQSDQPTGWLAQGQSEACVVIGTNINVLATTTVTGSRPLVLFASENLTIASGGVLDASSKKGGARGPASPSSACNAPIRDPGTGGGGAGGSFMSLGGDGGQGNGGSVGGRAGDNVATPPAALRGGCDGQAGGGNTEVVGRGGGVVYLIASGTLAIEGAINASGSAGEGGDDRSGGNGGGSGGMIVLHAPTITATGTLIANGGGGAGGGSNNADGADGFDPSIATPTTSAAGGPGPGGPGGRGFATGSSATDGDGDGGANTGGGGGGGGGGYIKANLALPNAQVSAGRIDAP